MFLHLGKDALIPLREIVAIIDGGAVGAAGTEEFVTGARTSGRLVDLAEGRPHAYVITPQRVYVSAISSLTLRKRAGWLGLAEGSPSDTPESS
ncbi:MAG TPA: extracellular matrix/biofilm biosynthesis regulator RemA family protein [Limnochordia bacterium]